jgi:hypothetical protein
VTPSKNPIERATDLVWSFYFKLEHTFNDEYSINDWNICVSCAKDVVKEIFDFMKEDDDLNDSCHYANSPWVNYWLEVEKELENLYKPYKPYYPNPPKDRVLREPSWLETLTFGLYKTKKYIKRTNE